METSFPVRRGANLDFRFTSTNGSFFILKARVVHTRRVLFQPGPVFHLSGLEFADQPTPSGKQAVDDLLERINWILSFYAGIGSSNGPSNPRTGSGDGHGRSR